MNSPEISYLADSLKRLQAKVDDLSASGPGGLINFLSTLVTKTISLNVGLVAANEMRESAAFSMAGAVVGKPVVIGLPAAPTPSVGFNAFANAPNEVTLRVLNPTITAITVGAATYGFLQIQQ